jgi:hypothetical protein
MDIEAIMTQEQIAELRESAYDYARLIQIEHFERNDIAVYRAYERLRQSLQEPQGLPEMPPASPIPQ